MFGLGEVEKREVEERGQVSPVWYEKNLQRETKNKERRKKMRLFLHLPFSPLLVHPFKLTIL